MAQRLFSHAETAQVMHRAGFSPEQIEEVLRDLPDPIDCDRDAEALMKHGITRDFLMDRAGGSP